MPRLCLCCPQVRVRSVEDTGGGMLTVNVFSFGSVQERAIMKDAWQRIYFEALFGALNPAS